MEPLAATNAGLEILKQGVQAIQGASRRKVDIRMGAAFNADQVSIYVSFASDAFPLTSVLDVNLGVFPLADGKYTSERLQQWVVPKEAAEKRHEHASLKLGRASSLLVRVPLLWLTGGAQVSDRLYLGPWINTTHGKKGAAFELDLRENNIRRLTGAWWNPGFRRALKRAVGRADIPFV